MVDAYTWDSTIWRQPPPIRDDWLSSLKTIESTFSLSTRHMALWKYQMEDHASNWLRLVLIFGLGQTMNVCSRVFTGDIYGDHVVSCSASKEVDIRLGERWDKPLRPADMLIYSYDRGIDLCVDLTGSSPLAQTGIVDFMSGHFVIESAQRKRVKCEAKCADIGYGFIPFLFFSFGELEKDAVSLLKRIRKFSVTQYIGACVAIHIFGRISFAIARGVGAQILSWLPTNFFVLWWLHMVVVRFHCPFVGLSGCYDGSGKRLTKTSLITYLSDRHCNSDAQAITRQSLSTNLAIFKEAEESDFVPPLNCGDGELRFMIYDITKLQVPSSSVQLDHVDELVLDEHVGFNLLLFDILLSKGLCTALHPLKHAPSLPLITIDHHQLIASLGVVLDMIKIFPHGTSCGCDGLRAQHLMDCLSGAIMAIYDELVSSITQVVNLFIDGKFLKILGEYIPSAPLTPLVKLGVAWYLDDGTIIGDIMVVREVLKLIMEDGPRRRLHLNVDKTDIFLAKGGPEKQ
ncbi:hypothetical protein Tco_0999169, partial [Tanacetum coccineum]